MISASVSVTQSSINWHTLKQIDRQGFKSLLPAPQPHFEGHFDERFSQYASQLLVEMENLYRQSLAQIEKKMQQSIQIFSHRISALEQEVATLKQLTIVMQNSDQPINQIEKDHSFDGELAMGKPASFIHIQEEGEDSLLQPQTVQKEQLIMNSARATAKRSNEKSSGNVRKLFEDDSSRRMRYQYSESMRPLSTKQSAYFQHSVREEVQNLRYCIQRAHNITVETRPYLPQVKVALKTIQVEPTRNKMAHLEHENQSLRYIMLKLRQKLQDTEEELGKIKRCLIQGVEEQDQFYDYF